MRDAVRIGAVAQDRFDDGFELVRFARRDGDAFGFEQFDAGLAILLKEPDMEKRRELEGKMKFGSLIGEMERLLKKANADGDIAMCLLHDEITQQTIGKFLAMMDWQIVPDKEAA